MKYKLVALDFDGTMYDSDMPSISQENSNAIREYITMGGKVVIATGRMYSSIRPYAQQLNLKGELISYQGASVYDIETSELLLHTPIDCDDAVEILKHFESNNYHCQFYYNDIFYAEEDNDYTKEYSNFCAIPINLTHMPLSEYVSVNSINPTKIMGILQSDELEEFYKLTSDKFRGRFGFAISCNKFIEVTNIGANKGIALKYLGEKYNIKPEEMVAMGDSINDLSMIKYAGLGIAVENAMDELKDNADYITTQASDNAVAKVLRLIIQDKL